MRSIFSYYMATRFQASFQVCLSILSTVHSPNSIQGYAVLTLFPLEQKEFLTKNSFAKSHRHRLASHFGFLYVFQLVNIWINLVCVVLLSKRCNPFHSLFLKSYEDYNPIDTLRFLFVYILLSSVFPFCVFDYKVFDSSTPEHSKKLF